RDRALRAVDLDADRVLATPREARGLEGREPATAQAPEEDRCVVDRDRPAALAGGSLEPRELRGDRALVDERLEQAAHPGEVLPRDELREVNDVRPDVTEGSRTGLLLVEPPRERRLRIGDPVLEVLRTHVPEGP